MKTFALILKFVVKPSSEKMLLIETTIYLTLSQVAVHCVPFKQTALLLGEHMISSPNDLSESDVVIARHVASAVNTMAMHMPWKSKCLARAISAKLMLKRRKIPCTLYLGVAKNGGKELAAHAWLRGGGIILTGRGGMKDFTIVSYFS